MLQCHGNSCHDTHINCKKHLLTRVPIIHPTQTQAPPTFHPLRGILFCLDVSGSIIVVFISSSPGDLGVPLRSDFQGLLSPPSLLGLLCCLQQVGGRGKGCQKWLNSSMQKMVCSMLHTIFVYIKLSWKILGMLKFWCRNSALDDWAHQQSLKNFNATFRPSRASSSIQPDKACDGQNVALKFLTDCWRAQLSKPEFLSNGALKFLSDCWRARSSKAVYRTVYNYSFQWPPALKKAVHDWLIEMQSHTQKYKNGGRLALRQAPCLWFDNPLRNHRDKECCVTALHPNFIHAHKHTDTVHSHGTSCRHACYPWPHIFIIMQNVSIDAHNMHVVYIQAKLTSTHEYIASHRWNGFSL